MKIEVIGEAELKAAMRKLGADLPAALADGLNRTMRGIEQAELNGMERQIDKPNPWSMNALAIGPANAKHVDASLFIKPSQAEYLKYPIEGGAVPSTITPIIGRAKLNAFGNIPAKKTRGVAGAQGRRSAGSRGFFTGRPGPKQTTQPFGLWERIGSDRVQAIAVREKGAGRTKRWDYYEIAEKVASDRLTRDALAALEAWASRGLK